MPPSLHRLFRQGTFLLTLALIPAALSAWLHPRGPSWRQDELKPGEVRIETATEWPDVLWVDARSSREFNEGHIPGAILLNEEEWEALFFDFIGVWDGEQPVVVYCGGGQCLASHRVAERLRTDLATDKIYVLKGGWPEWEKHR